MTAPAPGSAEAAARGVRFLEALAEDTPQPVRLKAWDDLAEVMADPAAMQATLASLVSVAGGMWESATGRRPDMWSFRLQTQFGPMPVDSAPPQLRWCGRWLTASLNNDFETSAALWLTVGDADTTQARQIGEVFVPMVVTFLTQAVRMFLAAGNPFPADYAEARGWGK